MKVQRRRKKYLTLIYTYLIFFIPSFIVIHKWNEMERNRIKNNGNPTPNFHLVSPLSMSTRCLLLPPGYLNIILFLFLHSICSIINGRYEVRIFLYFIRDTWIRLYGVFSKLELHQDLENKLFHSEILTYYKIYIYIQIIV